MSTPIARYFASLSFQVDKKQLKEIDRTLLNIENKLKAFQRRIGSALKLSLKVDKIDIDQKRLNIASQEAVKKASQNTIFEVTRFAVNDRNLQAAMMRAGRMIGQRVGGPASQQAVPQAVSPVIQQQPRQNIVTGRSHYMHAGGAAGAFARYGVESLPFLGGVYGLSQVNSISQELQANQLALRAVAGPNAGMYQEYLNNLGNRLGMTTRALQPSFTQYLANAQGTALEPTLTRDFESFTQYGAVMGLSQEEMKGSLKAITQMVSKQQIYA